MARSKLSNAKVGQLARRAEKLALQLHILFDTIYPDGAYLPLVPNRVSAAAANASDSARYAAKLLREEYEDRIEEALRRSSEAAAKV